MIEYDSKESIQFYNHFLSTFLGVILLCTRTFILCNLSSMVSYVIPARLINLFNIEAERRIYASVIQPSLVQLMACRLVGAKPLSKQCWNIVNWTLENKIQWNFNRNSNIFIQENAFEILVCEMATICLGFNVSKQSSLFRWFEFGVSLHRRAFL